MPYTFGDSCDASFRLRRLAEIYEFETRTLLELGAASRSAPPRLAVDLGCGPGWSTQLLNTVLHSTRTVGFDSSERYIEEARANHPQLEFWQHDVLQTPFPVEGPDVLLCRFLLTHLASPERALLTWGALAAPNAILLIHETEKLEAAHPALKRYYEMVDEMQSHYGQILNVGAVLNASLARTPWRIRESRSLLLEKPAQDMAQLHLLNLRTWGRNEYAIQAFDRAELDELEVSLDSIVRGTMEAGVVKNTARQIVAEHILC